MFKNTKYTPAVEINETELQSVDVSEHFDGQKHRNWRLGGVSFHNPVDLEGGAKHSDIHYNRDLLGRQTLRPKDLQRYIDPTDGKPRRLIVQATRAVLAERTGDWRRTKIKGNAPIMLRLSNWALKDVLLKPDGSKYTAQDVAIVVGKTILTFPALVCVVMLPMNSTTSHQGLYTSVPTVSWEYPLYARNQIDASPALRTTTTRVWQDAQGMHHEDEFDFARLHARRLKPSYLVVRHGQNWNIEKNVDDLPYLMVSFTRAHFDENSGALYQKAAELTTKAGLKAYWLDFCINTASSQGQTDEIHTICDIVRGARQVVVVVKDMSRASLTDWGRRMWTLAEVLLSSNELILFAPIHGGVEERSRVSLATSVWDNDQDARLLAEHFSGTLTLSRIELISVALRALTARRTTTFMPGDIAYALMGLLGRRPAANPHDNLFQALARLSLTNDSDRIVERMACMLPQLSAEINTNNKGFVLDDRYGSELWDIEPLCQVAGVCEGHAIIIDGCRGATIHWDKIPTIAYFRRRTNGRKAAEFIARGGPIVLLVGIVLVASGISKGFGAFILVVAIALTLASPWTIMQTYGGKVWGAYPWLIGFEGTLPIREIESITFGNAIGRLKYAASSSLLGERLEKERIGKEPGWITNSEPPPRGSILGAQRIFTLIDTGTMTVSVFAAERPPSVALVVGREGGMLRVALCSYERSKGALIKESVLRMDTTMLDRARLLGWVKLELP